MCAIAFALALGGETATIAQTDSTTAARSLIRAAFERYNTTWYRSLTFVQQTIRFAPDGKSDTAVWYEAYSAPGRLRIDVAPLADHTMILFTSDSQYVFRHDTLTSAQRFIHPLLLLGFDLNFLPPDQTVARLEELGFDMKAVHDDTWLNRPVVVVGASRGDTASAQFWLDAERLVFVRLIMTVGGRHQEVQFNRYQELAGGWIAPEVVALMDGRMVMKEIYSEMRTAVPFDVTFFDPSQWRTARHWRSERPGQ
jgi:hypothetical protein